MSSHVSKHKPIIKIVFNELTDCLSMKPLILRWMSGKDPGHRAEQKHCKQ